MYVQNVYMKQSLKGQINESVIKSHIHFDPHFGPKTHLELAVKANAAEAKVGQLEVTGPRNQHVIRFHVAMHNSLGGRGDLIIQIIKKTLKIRA